MDMAGSFALFTVLLVMAGAITTFAELDDSLQDYLKDEEFHQWVSKFYKDGENLAEVYPIWRRNADFVKHHNSLQGLSYTVSLNEYAHLNVKNLIGKQKLLVPEFKQNTNVPLEHDIPASIDWRDKGVVTPVRNQGQCGSASLFAIFDAIESFWAIKNGHLVMASLEECIDCCMNGSCNGGTRGWGLSLYQCIANLGGLATEYTSINHTCQSHKYPPVIKISGGKFVEPLGNEKALAEVVAKQPVAVAVDASHSSFQLYKEGVYFDRGCSSTKLDHALLVVGYGSNKNGEDFWIAKNSWGESWGMRGYILMARNRNNNCGIASQPTYPY